MDSLKYRLLMMNGVIAVGEDSKGIVIYVKKGFRPEGIPENVRVKEMDVLKNYFSTLSRIRPVQAGVSISHYRGSAGTLGGIVWDGSRYLGLGANHVIALRWGEKRIGMYGDPIIQPGRSDGGKYPYDMIGILEKWVDVDIDRVNKIDAAVFRIDGEIVNVIPEIGEVYGVTKPRPGMIVKKFGRTSLLTFSEIEAVNVAAKVYQWGVAIFEDQFLVKQPFSFAGDSGSLILDENNRAVGMVIAGNRYYTLASRADIIEKMLGIKISMVGKYA